MGSGARWRFSNEPAAPRETVAGQALPPPEHGTELLQLFHLLLQLPRNRFRAITSLLYTDSGIGL